MSSDPAPGRRPRSTRLWTEPRETEEHQRWLQPPARPAPPPPPGDEADGDAGAAPLARVRRRWIALLALGAIAGLIAIAALTANLVGDRYSPKPVAVLPAAPGAPPADQRSRAVRSIYAAASPSVFNIRVREGASGASGTGFLIDGNGTIVTNAHVVDSAKQVQVRLDDRGRDATARVIGADESSDLAVLRISAADAAGLRPLALADSDAVQVGDLAVAIGYPLGLDRTATAGIVSGVGRSIQAPNGFSIDKVIQTDAPINPGNSGGPLLDGAGRVIGVNSQIATTGAGGGSVGIGFAVPSNSVREVVPRLERGDLIKRPFLGVSTTASPTRPGALVGDVVASGPAQAAGIAAGDVITSVDGRPVQAPEDVSAAVERRRPGEQVDVDVLRGGAPRRLHVTLGTRPERTP